MTTTTPAHDFLQPRLLALVAEAEQSGIARDVAVAVMIDLVTGQGFNLVVPDPKDDTEAGRQPNYAFEDSQASAAEIAAASVMPGTGAGPLTDGVLAGRDFISPT